MMTFFREWLPLAKSDFRILALLADKGDFEGNLSDLCRCFSLDTQTKNRNKLREAILRLAAAGLILHKEKGRTHQLTLVPQAHGIEFPRAWYEILRQHDYNSESVSWEAVVKVALWIQDNQLPVVTNDMIAQDLDISVGTIGAAKNVLEREYQAITRKKISEKIGEDRQGQALYRTIGQELNSCAWWENT